MQRRRHPNYVRRTAAATFGPALGGLACLGLGVVLRGTALRDLETILNVVFVGASIAAGVSFFRSREATPCPACGATLSAERAVPAADEMTFPCRSCEILWTTDGAAPVDASPAEDDA